MKLSGWIVLGIIIVFFGLSIFALILTQVKISREDKSCRIAGYDYSERVGDYEIGYGANCCSDNIIKVINTDGTYFYEKETKCIALNGNSTKEIVK